VGGHAATVSIMFERSLKRIKEMLSYLSLYNREPGEPPDRADDRDAGIPVPVRRGPPDRDSSVAVAEPDENE
jgi:hypothetical protein